MSFCDEFQDFLLFLISLPLDFIIAGDFNISYGGGSSDVVAMNNILDIFNLEQHVNFPTHKFRNTLDWLITSDACDLINKRRSTYQMSDRSSFIATLCMPIFVHQRKKWITDATENLTYII